jgi:dihydrofolate synthase/folylpolyglutamate synthase
MYQRIGAAAYKVDLSNTLKLCDRLKQPHEGFKSVHVAGTNGKGSTSHMLASIFQEAGYKTGLYTSPHLKGFRERIKIDGKKIPEKSVVSFVKEHKSFFEENALSFFEMTVGLAFDHFSKEKVDIAIIEVGLGGRLDSTNVILPELSIITNIGLDHTQFLGNTLEEIAFEKGGIIKTGIPVIVGEYHPETKPVFDRIANKYDSPIVYVDQEEAVNFTTDLQGSYQKKNVRTVVAAIHQLNELGWEIHKEDIKRGLNKTVKNTGLLGRWQLLKQSPLVICDIAHNAEGVKEIVIQLENHIYDELHMVLGFVNDKKLDKVLSLFPKEAHYYFCRPNIERGLDAFELQEMAEQFGLKGETYNSVKKAYKGALKSASKNDLVYVGGSAFVVAEIL